MTKIIPVIDLFAGPGGLSEGFSAFKNSSGHPFKAKLSIEKDPVAHQTLLLRNFFRQFPPHSVPREYYQYLRKEITKDELFKKYADQASQSASEVWCAELGSKDFPHELVDERIERALGNPNPKNWLLIGGPPCQAYSIAGRSRMKGFKKFKNDPRHFLYREYLRIIAQHKPAVFIMENVKGLISSTVKGENMFSRIISDLKNPQIALEIRNKSSLNYKIYSLVNPVDNPELHEPRDFIIKSEKYSIPQARHRVILLGIRSDLEVRPGFLQPCKKPVPIRNVISDLPKLRSMLSREVDSDAAWRKTIKSIAKTTFFSEIKDNVFKNVLLKYLKKIEQRKIDQGADYYECAVWPRYKTRWYYDPKLNGVCNHASRGHMKDDLYRYFYAACFAKYYKRSPRMVDFPSALLPKHKNVIEAVNGKMFTDRFKVQVSNRPSMTITSHISKDGHYFIHHDPSQCRSLTVREAARLQTFPDNYFFEGNRTQQYHQVGNAVPPLLAKQIAKVVYDLIKN